MADASHPRRASRAKSTTPRSRPRLWRALALAGCLAGAAEAASSVALPGSLAPASSRALPSTASRGPLVAPLPPTTVIPVLPMPVVPSPPGPSQPVGASVIGVAAHCGEEDVSANPLSPHRGDVAVRVTLANPSRRTALTGKLSLRLSPGALSVDCEAVAIPAAGTQVVDCWLPFERAPAAASVELRLGTSPSASAPPAPESVRFECVAVPPAQNVVMTSKTRSSCGVRQGAGGLWLGEVAAQAPHLDRTYCAYSWQGSGEPDLQVFRGESWQVDTPVVVPLGGVALDEVAAVTADRLGVARALEAMAELPPAATRVRLAVLDTAALGFDIDAQDDNSDHGRIVGLAAQRVACGGATDRDVCPVDIDNRLAMPILAAWPRYAEDRARGGFFGTRAQLAVALHELLDDWEAGGQAEPLVINLSLGWHSKHDCATRGCGAPLHADLSSQVAVPADLQLFPSGKLPGPLEPANFRTSMAASEAVLLEIVRARCLGALVIAAAGNAIGRDRDGPLLPGAWNQLELAPQTDGSQFAPQCAGWVDRQNLDTKPAGYGAPVGPLLEAVGGTAFDGQALATARFRSLPRLNAYGAGITLSDTRPRSQKSSEHPGWLDPTSGTSLAAAVVSGAAARLWAQAGEGIAAHRVLDQLHLDARRTPVSDASGDARQAELFASASAPPAREVTACTVPHAFGVPCAITRANPGLILAESAPASLPQICLLESIAAAPPELCPVAPEVTHQLGDTLDDCPPDVSCPPEPPAIDAYEAPWVMPQPWGISCATCSEFHESFGFFTAYAIDLDVAAPAFSGPAGNTSPAPHIVGAAVRAGSARSELSLTGIKSHLGEHDVLQGRLYLDLWVDPAPASLIVRFGKTAGTLDVMTETETALISIEAP